MRPPILFLTVAFGVGLWAGLDPFVFAGAALWGVALSLIAAAACLAARTPLGAAVGIMGVAGLLWGRAGSWMPMSSPERAPGPCGCAGRKAPAPAAARRGWWPGSGPGACWS